MTERERCGHPKSEGGDPCQSWPACDDCDRCWIHCPHVEEERAHARKKGGVNSRKTDNEDQVVPFGDAPEPPETLDDAVRWASWAAMQVAVGGLDTSRANSVARLLKEFRQALEKSESREALEKIEAMRERLEGGGLEVVE